MCGFGEEAVAGVDVRDVVFLREGEDEGGVEVGAGRGKGDGVRVGGVRDVGGGGEGECLDAEFARGGEDAESDFASVVC